MCLQGKSWDLPEGNSVGQRRENAVGGMIWDVDEALAPWDGNYGNVVSLLSYFCVLVWGLSLEASRMCTCRTDLVPVAGILYSLLASCGETTNSAPWNPSVKPPVVPAALHVLVWWDLQGWTWLLVLILLQGAGMWLCWDRGSNEGFEDVGVALPDCARRTPALIISSPDKSWRQDC